MIWAYIRRKVTAAVLGGIQDAIDTLESGQTVQEPLPLPEPEVRGKKARA